MGTPRVNASRPSHPTPAAKQWQSLRQGPVESRHRCRLAYLFIWAGSAAPEAIRRDGERVRRPGLESSSCDTLRLLL
jgi:hypothetical protein